MADLSMVTPMVRRHLVELYVERYTSGNMTAQLRIERGRVPFTTVVYEGRGRVHSLAGSVQMGFGDEPQYMVSGTASIPVMTDDDTAFNDPQVNDSVYVVQHHDPDIVGRMFRVMHVTHGGQFNGVISMTVMGSEDSPTTTDGALPRRVARTNHDYRMADDG